MNNKEIAKLLRNIAAAYTLIDENKFRFQIIAYERAADAVEHQSSDIKDLWDDGKLSEISGIGPSIKQHLDELFTKGRVKHFDELLKGIPKAIFTLMKISGMGPKRAFKLVKTLKLYNEKKAIDELEKAAKNGKIRKIKTFGEVSEADILKNIEQYRKGQIKENRMVLPYAYEIAAEIVNYLKKLPEAITVEPLGSLRRMVATIGDIDIAVASNHGQKVLEYFTNYPKKKRLLEKGDNTASIILNNGHQIDLMVQPPGGFGALLQHFTGSKHHNIHLREYALKRGFSLSEYGIKINRKLKRFSTEKEFYNALELTWIPPELREDNGEIEAASKNKLPKLVSLKDIKGDLHLHSNYNLEPSHDLGQNTMKEMTEEGDVLGYEYIAMSEHSPSISNHTKTQIINIIRKRKEYIEQLLYPRENVKSKRVKKIFNSLEVDILTDGKLSIPKEVLGLLDYYIVSVHSSFKMSKEDMTKRILTALSVKGAKILGHPTGRLLNKREGYEANWDKIFDFCAKENKAIEINSFPDRLDLPDILVKEAIKKSVRLVINTDSHAVDQMKNMFYGVSVARRGWAKASDIINTMPYNEFNKWISI